MNAIFRIRNPTHRLFILLMVCKLSTLRPCVYRKIALGPKNVSSFDANVLRKSDYHALVKLPQVHSHMYVYTYAEE